VPGAAAPCWHLGRIHYAPLPGARARRPRAQPWQQSVCI
jgi:hypothetical protein